MANNSSTTLKQNGVYARWLDFPGEQMIAQVEVEIGGQRIDRQNGDWMHIWNQLTLTKEQERGYFKMVGNTTQLTFITDPSFNSVDGPCASSAPTQVCAPRSALPETTLYVPFQFWYCRNPGLALPLIALQYHEVKINLDIRPIDECLWAVNNLANNTTGSGNTNNVSQKVTTAYNQSLVAASLYVDYVFLDTDERRRMAQNPHEYLIEQIQYTSPISIPIGATSSTVRLEFNHPIRELLWFIKRSQMDTYHDYYNFSSTSILETGVRKDLMADAVIQLDGYDRFDRRDAGYFRLVQPYYHHTTVPANLFIYNYCFALRPEELQPSGSLNASRIDNFVLQMNLVPDAASGNPPARGNAITRVYATNHNVLRIVNGFGGLLFTI